MKRVVTLLAVALLASMTAFAGSIVIDNFTGTQAVPTLHAIGDSNNLKTGLTTTNTIGGTRYLDLNVTTDPTGQNGDLSVTNVGQNLLNMSLGPGVWATGTATYDDNGLGLGEQFFTVLGAGANASNTYFQATIVTSDHNVKLTASFTDNSNNVATYDFGNLASGSFVNQAFSSFTNAGSTNFNNIKSISVALISTSAATDTQLSLFEVTNTPNNGSPEPATMALLGSALVGLGVLGRKRLVR